jgi:hypothetical protein
MMLLKQKKNNKMEVKNPKEKIHGQKVLLNLNQSRKNHNHQKNSLEVVKKKMILLCKDLILKEYQKRKKKK